MLLSDAFVLLSLIESQSTLMTGKTFASKIYYSLLHVGPSEELWVQGTRMLEVYMVQPTSCSRLKGQLISSYMISSNSDISLWLPHLNSFPYHHPCWLSYYIYHPLLNIYLIRRIILLSSSPFSTLLLSSLLSCPYCFSLLPPFNWLWSLVLLFTYFFHVLYLISFAYQRGIGVQVWRVELCRRYQLATCNSRLASHRYCLIGGRSIGTGNGGVS